MAINSIVNFRDLGGLATRYGKTIKPAKLLRSGELVGISQSDKVLLKEKYQLQTIVDLRGADELQKAPDDDFPGTAYHHIDIMKSTGEKVASKEEMMRQISLADAHSKMVTLYGMLICNKDASTGYRQFVQLCATQQEGSILFHCFAGKDRTGLAAAIMLGILGVSRADIMQDYLLTNALRAQANRILLAEAEKECADPDYLAVLDCMLCVQPVYLEAAFEAMDEAYGGMDGYLKWIRHK